MKIKLAIAAAFLALGSYDANAETVYSGGKLYIHCKSFASGDMSAAFAFEKGVCVATINAFMAANKFLSFCPPNSANNMQALMLVLRYMENDPQQMHADYTTIAYNALRQAWPCKS
jgi:hypothetical protein